MMRERGRRQSRRRTRVELRRSLSADGRAWVTEVWQAAEDLARDPSLLGSLTSALAVGFIERYAATEEPEAEDTQRSLFAVIKTGYASRTVLVGPTSQPSLEASSFRIDEPFDVEQVANDAGALGQLIDRVRSIASADFDSVMTLPRDVWSAYVAIATMQLQRDLASSTLTWRQLDRETVGGLLRYGYVLACLDEALDGSPKPRGDDG
jgi:hypothetical protein